MIGSRSLIFLGALVLAAAGSAEAFQETAPVAPPVADAPASIDDPGTTLGLGPDEGADEAKSVPDLDFGLELLYGGKSSVPTEAGQADDDTGLKGRVRHTF